MAREGSIGLPFPDTYYKIVKPGTQEEVPYGEIGEICLSGPTVMLGYLGHEEENAQTLQKHPDGLTWVHTGDLGTMDEDGFVYFKQRLKRMIVTSGYNVYPSQLENVFDAHPLVQMSCVIGVPDELKMQKVKAFIMLKPGVVASQENKDILMAYARKHIAKYALPYDIEFRQELPKTLVGKVAYRVLERRSSSGGRPRSARRSPSASDLPRQIDPTGAAVLRRPLFPSPPLARAGQSGTISGGAGDIGRFLSRFWNKIPHSRQNFSLQAVRSML